MVYLTRLVLIGRLQETVEVLVTWVEDTVWYRKWEFHNFWMVGTGILISLDNYLRDNCGIWIFQWWHWLDKFSFRLTQNGKQSPSNLFGSIQNIHWLMISIHYKGSERHYHWYNLIMQEQLCCFSPKFLTAKTSRHKKKFKVYLCWQITSRSKLPIISSSEHMIVPFH